MSPELEIFVKVAKAIIEICGGFTVVCVAITWMIKVIKGAKKPETTQNDRLTKLEVRMDAVEGFLGNDNRRLNTIERGNRVTQEALLALLSHAIDGNNIDDLKSARKSLQTYLMDRGVEAPKGGTA